MLVSAATREAATERVQVWLSRQDAASLMVSDWVIAEIAAALPVKMRLNRLSVEGRTKAAGLFTRLTAESLTVVPVARDHFVAAARLADQHGLGLRAGDALHVAVAAAQGVTISTLDQRLAEAATALGVGSELV